jgi:arylsulfatase A-like enzyme
VWRPAPSAGIAPSVVPEPVGQLDLAPTFCGIAGIEAPGAMQGIPLPTGPGSGRERVLSEWDSQLDNGYRLRTIVRDRWLCTAYEPTKSGPDAIASSDLYGFYGVTAPVEPIRYDGTEGELYDLLDDPHQWVNRWDDPAFASLRSDLVDDLYANLPPPRSPRLAVESMA